MAKILDPQPGQSVYAPCVCSAGLLIKIQLYFKEKYKNKKVSDLKFYGQEILHFSFAMAKMNIFIHDMDAEIALGDTMNHPAFKKEDGSLMKFDLVATNPMWNQDFPQYVYENDPFRLSSFIICRLGMDTAHKYFPKRKRKSSSNFRHRKRVKGKWSRRK